MSVTQLVENVRTRAGTKLGKQFYNGDQNAMMRDVENVLALHRQGKRTDAYFAEKYGEGDGLEHKKFINTLFGLMTKAQQDINPLFVEEGIGYSSNVFKSRRLDRINHSAKLQGRPALPFGYTEVKGNYFPLGIPSGDIRGIATPSPAIASDIPRISVQRPASGVIATKANLLPGGRAEVIIPTSDWNSSVGDVIDEALLSLTEEPGVFWRGTNNKTEPAIVGDLISRNHADGRSEGGVSVSRRLGLFAYDYYYPVAGNVLRTGSDGEPVLQNAKPIGEVLTLEKARKLHESKITKRLAEIGWTREQYRNALFDRKWEKVE
jgi:hypothetical protein